MLPLIEPLELWHWSLRDDGVYTDTCLILRLDIFCTVFLYVVSTETFMDFVRAGGAGPADPMTAGQARGVLGSIPGDCWPFHFPLFSPHNI